MEHLFLFSAILFLIGVVCILIVAVIIVTNPAEKQKRNFFLFLGFLFILIGAITYYLSLETTPTNPLPPNNTSNPPEIAEKNTSFEITEPKEGSYVKHKSTVFGQGAMIGSSINIYVIDKYGQIYQEVTVDPTVDGLWTCSDINIGQFGTQYAGQNFTIFANFTKDNKSYETSHIHVTRS
jgi:hypothetical protein